MALRTCPHCEKTYSESVLVCPHCHFEPQIIVCPECDALCSVGEKMCSACGYDLSSSALILAPRERVKELYDHALSSLKTASAAEEYVSLEKDFLFLGSYEDAPKRAAFCKATYLSSKTKTASELKTVSDLFAAAGDTESSHKYREMYLDKSYKAALSKTDTASSVADWTAALKLFTDCEDYKESKTWIGVCEKKIRSLNNRHTGKIIGWISGSVIAVAAVILFFVVALPAMNYNKAADLFDNGEYLSAEKIFLSLDDYKDSAEKAVETVQAKEYTEAEALFQKGDYVLAAETYSLAGYKDSNEKILECGKNLVWNEEFDDAVTVLALTDADGASDYLDYANAMLKFNSGKYSDAIDIFRGISDIENSHEKLHESYYRYGKQLFTSKNYDDAAIEFSRAGDYSNASEMIYACDLMEAEDYLDMGYLNTALSLYESLPEDFEYNGISVSSRLDLLEDYSEYLPLCGKWKASGTQKYHTEQVSKRYGNWRYWDSEWDDPYQYISVTCKINGDGTVDVSGQVEYYRYTNYSSISIGLDMDEKTARIDRTVSSPLDDWYYVNSGDDYCCIKYSDGVYKLNYYNYSANEDVYFDYIYSSDCYYGNQVEVY